MPTNNKTSLGFNSWVDTDKPKRSDFVDDNKLLNNLLMAHFNDNQKHLTEKDKDFVNESIVVGKYCGDGKATQEVTLPFEPKFLIVFHEEAQVNFYIGPTQLNLCNFGIASKEGCTEGVSIKENKLTVSQTLNPVKDGVIINLNSYLDHYIYFAFK